MKANPMATADPSTPDNRHTPWRCMNVTSSLCQLSILPVTGLAPDPVIAAYQAFAGRAVASFFVRLPDPADHPVFRLDPRSR